MNPTPPQDMTKLGIKLASVHLVAFLLSSFLAQQGQGWAGIFVWPIWLLIDFPISLLHLLFWKTSVGTLIDTMRASNVAMDYLFYSPILVHGIVGTIWWAFVPKIYFCFRSGRARA